MKEGGKGERERCECIFMGTHAVEVVDVGVKEERETSVVCCQRLGVAHLTRSHIGMRAYAHT